MTALSTAIVAVLAILLLLGVDAYILATRRGRAGQAWSRVDRWLRYRHELISRLIARAPGGTGDDTIEAVRTACRAAIRAGALSDPAGAAVAEDALSARLGTLLDLAVAGDEARPDARVRVLVRELAIVDAAIGDSGSAYNILVCRFNAGIRRPPGRVVAAAFALRPLPSFAGARSGAPVAPSVLRR